MQEDRVTEEVKRAISESEITDIIMPFGVYISILIFLNIIGFIFNVSTNYPFFGFLGFIPAMMFGAYIFYKLIKREEHFKRERKLLSNLIFLFEGKVDESKISNLRTELKDREIDEEEKQPMIWAVLTLIPYFNILTSIYIYYFLGKDFYRHDKRETYFLQGIHNAMESIGIAFLIQLKPHEMPKRNFWLYLFLTIITFGLFGIYWFYILFKDPNVHFEYQKNWEDSLLEALTQIQSKATPPESDQSYIEVEGQKYWGPEEIPEAMTPTPAKVKASEKAKASTKVRTSTKVRASTKVKTATKVKASAKAKLILSNNREIELMQNEMIFGKNDFEDDISEENLSYITRKEDDRYQFKIITKEGIFYIQDNNSTNGTKLNDIEIKGEVMKELKNEDKITLAGIDSFMMIFKIERT